MDRGFKTLFCCGSRPEFIKISPVYHRLKAIEGISPLLCNTGQHTDLLAPHLKQLQLKPDYQLEVMRNGQSLDQLIKQLFEQLPQLFDLCRPDMVIIQGDTASAFSSAMIAHKKGYPIAHIEAGLRTHDRTSPFPEEIYRQSISPLTTWHFCPTELARQNLRQEGVPAENIFVTGNTSVDMVLETFESLTNGQGDLLPNASLSPHLSPEKPYFLITLHRRESQGAPLIKITNCLLEFAKQHPEFDFIVPLHPNPATSDMIKNLLSPQSNIHLIAPMAYPHFVSLMANAFAIITDSGGIQEEAPSLNTPVLIVRNITERSEGIESGCLRLAGTKRDTILQELNRLVEDKDHYQKLQQAPNPFGDGRAAKRIVKHLKIIAERNR